MYIPSQVLVGPLPLFNALLIAAAALAFVLQERMKAPGRVQDLLWALILGGLLGDKGIYIATDPAYFVHNPSHLIFTPESRLGLWGAAAGAGLALFSVLVYHRKRWALSDLDAIALTVSPALALWAMGFNWIGVATRIPLLTIATRHLNHFATYFLWAILMAVGSGAIWTLHRSHALKPGQIAGVFLMTTAITTVLASLTAASRGNPFTSLQWFAVVLAVAGYRLMGE